MAGNTTQNSKQCSHCSPPPRLFPPVTVPAGKRCFIGGFALFSVLKRSLTDLSLLTDRWAERFLLRVRLFLARKYSIYVILNCFTRNSILDMCNVSWGIIPVPCGNSFWLATAFIMPGCYWKTLRQVSAPLLFLAPGVLTNQVSSWGAKNLQQSVNKLWLLSRMNQNAACQTN